MWKWQHRKTFKLIGCPDPSGVWKPRLYKRPWQETPLNAIGLTSEPTSHCGRKSSGCLGLLGLGRSLVFTSNFTLGVGGNPRDMQTPFVKLYSSCKTRLAFPEHSKVFLSGRRPELCFQFHQACQYPFRKAKGEQIWSNLPISLHGSQENRCSKRAR